MIFQKTNFKLNCSQYDIVDVSRSNRKQPFFHINCINSGRNYLMGNDYFNQTTFGIKCRVVKCEVKFKNISLDSIYFIYIISNILIFDIIQFLI